MVRKIRLILLIVTGVIVYLLIYSAFPRYLSLSKFYMLFRRSNSCSSPVRNIAFLKTHKCASTSLQNTFIRYGLLNNLTFALPESGNYFEMITPFEAEMIPSALRKNLELNIFAIHTVWNDEAVRSVMPADTKFISAIRDPTRIFESLYSYADNFDSNMTINEYVREAPAERIWNKFNKGYNQLSYDFGIPVPLLSDLNYIQKTIEDMDKNFDLIMVTERMEESLILLRNELCWTHSQVATLRLNSRTDEYKMSLEKDTTKMLRSLLQSDYMIYEYFVRKFDIKVRRFGSDKMRREKILLRKAVNDLKRRCGIRKFDPNYPVEEKNKMYSPKVSSFVSESSELECILLESSEYFLLDYIRKRQQKMLFQITGDSAFTSTQLPLENSSLSDFDYDL